MGRCLGASLGQTGNLTSPRYGRPSSSQRKADEVAIIEVEDLVKEFRRPKRVEGPFSGVRTLFTRQYVSKLAVAGISLEIGEGELLGYLGRNGAGKSTSIKMLSGILEPTAGSVNVAGLVPWKDRQRNALNVGAVFGQRTQLWWDLPLRDSLELLGKLYGLSRARYDSNVAEFTRVLELDPFIDTPVRQLSLGQRMRGDLAAAMLHEPRILYLDEPTIGLDVVAKQRIREFIQTLNRQRGVTVLLTTHDIHDVEALCDRIVLIDNGRVLYDGDVSTLKNQGGRSRQLVVHLADEQRWAGVGLDQLDAIEVDSAAGTATISFDPERVPVSDLISAVCSRNTVRDLAIIEPELEVVIRQIYSGSATDAAASQSMERTP